MPAPQLADDPETEPESDDEPADETEATEAEPDATDETDETDTMPDDDTPEEPPAPDAETDPDDEPDADGESEAEAEEDVAEATMPEEAEEAAAEEGESGGILGRINTKAVIALAAVVVVGTVLLWLLRQGGTLGRNTSPTDDELDEEMAHEGGDEGEYELNAPDNDPLAQDAEMMGMLGLGGEQ